MREYEIDGAQFSTLDGFFAVLAPILRDVGLWNEDSPPNHLLELDEILEGWFNVQATEDADWPPGKPETFAIRWKNSSLSRERLGLRATIKQEKKRLAYLRRHPQEQVGGGVMSREERMEYHRTNISDLRQGNGKTLFDQLVEIFRHAAPPAPGVLRDPVDGVILLLD